MFSFIKFRDQQRSVIRCTISFDFFVKFFSLPVQLHIVACCSKFISDDNLLSMKFNVPYTTHECEAVIIAETYSVTSYAK